MSIKILLVDVGGVLLTNGWDTPLRNLVAAHYLLDPTEMQKRHEEVFDDFECGRCSFDEYLQHVVFFKLRSFTLAEFKEFVFALSKEYPKTIVRIKALKDHHQAKLVLLSNEGREIAEYRFNKFKFHDYVDFSIVSGFVGFRKPDPRMYQLALDLCQEDPKNILYIDDRAHYFTVAKTFGLRTAHVDSTLWIFF
ncbi:MAG: HAD-IA family hydrolase [Parachlamydiaceae bacterium]|nr:HAD-IA family hydrolase [Parachlamydiaceae bacterium]